MFPKIDNPVEFGSFLINIIIPKEERNDALELLIKMNFEEEKDDEEFFDTEGSE